MPHLVRNIESRLKKLIISNTNYSKKKTDNRQLLGNFFPLCLCEYRLFSNAGTSFFQDKSSMGYIIYLPNQSSLSILAKSIVVEWLSNQQAHTYKYKKLKTKVTTLLYQYL